MQRKGTFTNEDSLFQQITNITKASAYDIVSKQVQELTAENTELKIKLAGAEKRIEALKEFINDVRPKDAKVIEMPHPEPPIGDIW